MATTVAVGFGGAEMPAVLPAPESVVFSDVAADARYFWPFGATDALTLAGLADAAGYCRDCEARS